MSHFTVLVIGADPEKQLAPYHEYECTGRLDEYVVFVPVSDEDMDECQKRFEEKKDKYASFAEFMSDYEGCEERDGVYGRMTNPNAKWDWYVLGGRWTGYFTLKGKKVGVVGKPGLMTPKANPIGKADSALKGEIDFEAMRNEAEALALERFEKAYKILSVLPEHKHFDTILAEVGGEDYKKTRELYWAQPRCQAWQKSLQDDFDWMSTPDDFNMDKEAYLKSARNGAISTYAFIKDSQWVGKGEMGWRGISSGDMKESDWNEKFNELIDSLPDDTPLHVYDCHI